MTISIACAGFLFVMATGNILRFVVEGHDRRWMYVAMFQTALGAFNVALWEAFR